MQTDTKTPPSLPIGGLRHLWKISLPLMISSLATLFMIFVDRCFLASYSLDNLNAAVNGGTLAWAHLGTLGMITGISSVFVAQYYGAKQVEKIGQPVWQMIWVSLAAFLVLIPIGVFSGPFIFQHLPNSHLPSQYFRILLTLAPSYGLVSALSGFFIGRGKTKLILLLAIGANVINIVFDRILIFGIKGIVPELGISGAAIATSMGSIFQAIFLMAIFLKKENHARFNTRDWQLRVPLMIKCLKVATPQALFYGFELIGWSIFYFMMTSMSEMHITVSSICQTLIILLSFFFEGLTKGVSAISAQMIGARNKDNIRKLLKSALLLLLLFTIASTVLIVGFPQLLINSLLPGNTPIVPSGHVMMVSLICVIGYLFFEGIRWILGGILTAAGDTLFLFIGGSLSVWVCLLLPEYFIVVRNSLSVEVAWIVAACYAAFLAIFYYGRYQQGKWKQIELVHQTTTPPDGNEQELETS